MPGKTRKKRQSVPVLLRRLRKHFDAEPADLPVVEQTFDMHERPNLHLAIEEMLAGTGRKMDLLGVLARDEYSSPSLGRLSREASAKRFEQGPVEHVDVSLPGGEQAEWFLRQLQRLTSHGKAYRGHVLSVEEDCHGRVNIQSHSLPAIQRDEVILPEPLMKRIERDTLSFSKHAERLRAARRHLKRGILLYGPPGTGSSRERRESVERSFGSYCARPAYTLRRKTAAIRWWCGTDTWRRD
jgi:cell division protease FtsH